VRGPERPEGKRVRDHVRKLLKEAQVWVEFLEKRDKYGRSLGRIYFRAKNVEDEVVCLNDHLVQNGMATVYMRR
jgi:endonuclease YncB( thermonuclease family)